MTYLAYEIRPCIETGDAKDSSHVESFVSEEAFYAAIEREDHEGGNYESFWTIYGRYDDGDGCLLAEAIGDFASKETAHSVLKSILGPLAKAIDLIEGPDIEGDNGAVITGPEQAAEYLRHIVKTSAQIS